MSVVRRASAWATRRSESTWAVIPEGHSARITDAALSALIIVRVALVGSVPTAQLAVIALIGIALFRRPTRRFGLAAWFPWLASGLLIYAWVVTFASGLDPLRRGANIGLLITLACFMASGRIDAGSMIKGLGVGLGLNAVLYYLHLAPDDYAGRLTGFLQDPNAAGLVIAVGALLFTLAVSRRWARVAVVGLGAWALWETGSRTSMAAYVCAVVWLSLSARLGRALQIALGLVVAVGFIWASNTIASNVGTFESRSGSDALRSRIDDASTAKVLEAPWHGFGLGQGTVVVNHNTWFFNSSYQDLVAEGGYILAVGVLLCFVLAGFGLRASSERMRIQSWDTRTIAAATLVVFFCGSRLGEVFLSPTGFLVLGVGLTHLSILSRTEQGAAADDPAPWYRFALQATSAPAPRELGTLR